MLKRRTAGTPAIAYRIFRPREPAKVAVLMTFGYFENMKRYREVIEAWNALGLVVAIYDLRGHGLSEGGRGQILQFDDYVDDAVDLIRELDQDDAFQKLRPLVLFGHSLGGLISIHTAFRVPDKIAGLALSSPDARFLASCHRSRSTPDSRAPTARTPARSAKPTTTIP
jgi:alpha-beta hydrolase superfamily lysophospholipase